MIAMGPKIWVECINAPLNSPFHLGGVYFVEDFVLMPTGRCTCHGVQTPAAALVLRGAPGPRTPFSPGYCALNFKPIYRPDKTAEEWLRTGTPAPISKDDMIRAQAAFNLQRMGR